MRYTLCALSLACASLCSAQNQPPTVTITDTQVDLGAATVTVSYDLADAENDACTVTLRASMDGGTTYAVEVMQVIGDVGADVQPGTGRTITWNYGVLPNIWEATVMVVADDGNAPDIQAMVDQVDMGRIIQRMEQLSIPRHHSSHTQGITAIRDTLLQAFGAAGLEVGTQDVTFGGATVPNVIGRQPGLLQDTRTYIVDAHYDGVPNTPGADDNMSGMVATLEAAHILSQYRFQNSIRYIGFSYEEVGLIGSGQYVQNGIPGWEEIAGVLNMEMIGYYSDEPNSQTIPTGFELLFPAAIADISADEFRGNFLTVVGNVASQPLIDAYLEACSLYVPDLRTIALAVPGNGQIAPDLRRSDHARFWDAGMQALMLTDGSEFRNNNYHQPGDTPQTLDMEFLTNNAKATLAAAALLAQPMNAGFDTRALGQVGMADHLHHFPCTAEVFPNPARDVLHLRLGACSGYRIVAQLFDLGGRHVGGRDLRPGSDEERFELSVAHLPVGTYLLVLQAGDSSTTLKVEVQR
jgi:hypothetical protein